MTRPVIGVYVRGKSYFLTSSEKLRLRRVLEMTVKKYTKIFNDSTCVPNINSVLLKVLSQLVTDRESD